MLKGPFAPMASSSNGADVPAMALLFQIAIVLAVAAVVLLVVLFIALPGADQPGPRLVQPPGLPGPRADHEKIQRKVVRLRPRRAQP